jgi:hypothetical protein
MPAFGGFSAHTIRMGAERSAMHCSLRGLALLGSSLALGAACSDQGEQPDDYFLGAFAPGTFGGSSTGTSAKDGTAALDGGAALDGSAASDTGDSGARADIGQGYVEEPPVATCTPYCTGLSCGSPDGCGGTCMLACNCVPSCDPHGCWTSDGCGGVCIGGCCTPVCYSSDCGAADGCGGICNEGCVSCTPSCTEFDCGTSDGCGGTCNAGCPGEP